MTRTRRITIALLGTLTLTSVVADVALAAPGTARRRPAVNRPTVKLGGEETDGVAPKRTAKLGGEETDGVAPKRTAKAPKAGAKPARPAQATNAARRTAKLGGEETDGVAPRRPAAKLGGEETDGVAPRRTAKP